ncbi:hypothetical protein BJ165DRAFT_1436143 [Panaeolus papilionaceus]|nr:hypothetical protein BJ165DRAFT_1436143 [Panaeolus papilionaceus]
MPGVHPITSFILPVAASIALESTFEAVAIITTILRLWYRIYVQRFGWDDAWALAATLFSIVPYILFMISTLHPVLFLTTNSMFALRRLGGLTFYTAALWSAKLSVAVALVRLGTRTFETVSKITTCVLGLCGIALILQKIFICGTNLKEVPICDAPQYTGILELTLDLLADVWLLGAPFYLLYLLKLPRQHHRLISTIFACGFLATITSIVHGYYVIKKKGTLMIITSQIQVAISIVSCNLLILITYIYRRMHRDDETIEQTDNTDPSTNGRGVLATHNPQLVLSVGPHYSGATTHYTLTNIDSFMASSGYATSAIPSEMSRSRGASETTWKNPGRSPSSSYMSTFDIEEKASSASS